MAPPLLDIQNLTKIYGGGFLRREQTVALENFSMTMGEEGEEPKVITIAGESGSGKTTLANLVLGFITPTEGRILYKGQDIADMSGSKWIDFRREVQAVFQDPFGVYNPFYRVDHVFDTMIRRFNLARNHEEAQEITIDALKVMGLQPSEILGKYPHQLSGGQRQRIMIARAFLLKPRLIVADEPVSMIDASLQVRILDVLLRLREEFGIPILYITHDLATAYQISDEIVILYLGWVMEKGGIEAVMQDPQHPYTQLLVDSIPSPDPTEKWEQSLDLTSIEEVRTSGVGEGCRYVQRCPYMEQECLNAPPPLYKVGPNHYSSCYRHKGQPEG
ncbi:MAG: ABC transporter ATP-binding protein [Anaerolineae bacterium]